jgi:hypothetical protein
MFSSRVGDYFYEQVLDPKLIGDKLGTRAYLKAYNLP